jgi:PPOX class probable F420-dependent enzyme
VINRPNPSNIDRNALLINDGGGDGTSAGRWRENAGVTSLDDVAALARRDHGLAIVSTLRGDGTIHASLVNAGVLDHPITGEPHVAFVTYGKVKLANLRRRPQATVTFRAGWQWASVDGVAEVIGPDDPHEGIDPERLRILLREAFVAAGGTHDDWDAYDRVMAGERRAVVFVRPRRVYSNPTQA